MFTSDWHYHKCIFLQLYSPPSYVIILSTAIIKLITFVRKLAFSFGSNLLSHLKKFFISDGYLTIMLSYVTAEHDCFLD